MGFEYVSKLPTPDEIRAQFPLAPELAAEKARKDAAIRDVFTGDSDKFLVIIGPCSADREDAVIDYVNRLAKVQEKVKDKLILVPRIYTNKPRTTGDGYKGLLHQPNPEGKPNLYQGLIAIRKLHMRVIEETGFSTADEMLYPENLTYLSDVMSYVAVGARSVENQQHRLVASGIDVPVGMKNPTSGALSVMLNAVHAAQHGHEFIYRSWEVKTQGNPLTHTILRGAVNKHDQCLPNYHYEDLKLLLDLYNERDLKNPAALVNVVCIRNGSLHRTDVSLLPVHDPFGQSFKCNGNAMLIQVVPACEGKCLCKYGFDVCLYKQHRCGLSHHQIGGGKTG